MSNEIVSMKIYDNGLVVGSARVNKTAILVVVQKGNDKRLMLGPRGRKIATGTLISIGILGALGMGAYAVNQQVEISNIDNIVEQLGTPEYDKEIVKFIEDGLNKLREHPDIYDDSIPAIESYLSSMQYYEQHGNDDEHAADYRESWEGCVESCLGILNRAGIDYQFNTFNRSR